MFSLDLGGISDPLAVVVLAACILALLIICFAITRFGGVDFSIGMKPLHFDMHQRQSADKTREDQLRHAVEKLADVAKGLGAVAEADPADETPAKNWFHYLLENLGPALAKGNGDSFRIAIWTVDRDSKYLHGLSWYNIDRNAAEYKKLERQGTVAGYALQQGETQYIADEAKDPRYRERPSLRGKKSKAKCMIAVLLGDAPHWAVMTVDVNRVDGLSETQQEIISAFGGLATLGAHLAHLELSRQARPQRPTRHPLR